MVVRFLILSLCCMVAQKAIGQSGEQFFSKSFHTDNKTNLQLFLPGTIDLKVWKDASIKVEIGVVLPGASEAVVKGLSNTGRYNLVASSTETSLRLAAPNAQKQLRLKGQDVQETYRFIVYVPEGMTVEMLPAATPKSTEVTELATTAKRQ